MSQRIAPPRQFQFTKDALKALPVPKERTYYRDMENPDLFLAHTPQGAKSYFVQRRIDGTPRRLTIGRFPDLPIKLARQKASTLILEIASGADPYERTRPHRRGVTFGVFFNQYMERHAVPHLGPRTVAGYRTLYDNQLASLHGRRLASITRDDLQQMHVAWGEGAPYAANRALNLVRAVYSKAIEWGAYEGDNPATRIRRFKEEGRERFLQPDELRRLFTALQDEAEAHGPAGAHYFLLALFTGQRRENVRTMRWRDMDLQRAVWIVPGRQAKAGKSIVVPLSPPALAVLQERQRQAREGAEFVFQSERTEGPISPPKSAWDRIRKAARLQDVRPHDLRRTLGSWQAAAGASDLIIGRSLGHTSVEATRIYSRLNLDPVRASVEGAVQAMLEAGGYGETTATESDE